MILITTIIMEAGSRYTQQYYTGSWRHYLNYYHRLIQTASVIAGHDRSLFVFYRLAIYPSAINI